MILKRVNTHLKAISLKQIATLSLILISSFNICSAQNKVLPKLQIIFIEREQYQKDHHNTATLFQKGEINESKFDGGSSMKLLNLETKEIKTIFSSKDGVVRDPEISFDAERIIFSYRKNLDDDYHIYEIDCDGNNLKQLTFTKGVSDIDPLYLPSGDIVFTSTREPKFCMCNRHIMGNLYKMRADGSNIIQIGGSTLFEGHAALLNDGRIVYDRWEYVDRNFGDAQSLWSVNPDGTNHAVYYGNNMNSPGGVIDPRAIDNSSKVAAIFGSCHSRPWGAFVILDRSKGVDGEQSVDHIWPKHARSYIGVGNWDKFKKIKVRYEDPFPLNDSTFLISRSISTNLPNEQAPTKMGLYLLNTNGDEIKIYEGEQSAFDPIPLKNRYKPTTIPNKTNYSDKKGYFYVQDVYTGTHMEGVKRGDAKYLRVIESPEKRTWTERDWKGQGAQAPAMNWSSFENKQVLGTVPVEEDGSAYFEVDAGKYVFFQLLDKDKKMIQTMRSGTMAMPGEVNGCIGCHEDRLTVPTNRGSKLMALKTAPHQMESKISPFSYAKEVQPIFDKSCVKCHDFEQGDKKPAGGLVLAGDKNPWFNASYINLYIKKHVNLIGGGPADFYQPRSWGSNNSNLSKVIESEHHGVKLSDDEIETINRWMDLNGVYYPVYESAYPTNSGGRSPLTDSEFKRLEELTGVAMKNLEKMKRKLPAQISFDRPELSPILDSIRDSEEKFNEAISIITKGQERLKETPRADMENFIPCQENIDQLKKYEEMQMVEMRVREAIAAGDTIYDKL